MLASLRPFVPQPLTGIVAVGLGALLVVWGWFTMGAYPPLQADDFLLAVCLGTGLFLAARFPIHIRYNVKLMILTVPLYLIAVLLPPLLAALTAGVVMLLIALAARKRMGWLPSDIATSVGRWITTIYLVSLVAHLAQGHPEWNLLALLAAVPVMYVGDIIGTAFEISPMTGESPMRVLALVVREEGMPEAIQYLIGILGALVALQNVWNILLLGIPMIIVYFSFKRLKEMQDTTRALLEDMADEAERRDAYTGGHTRRVTEMCHALIQELGITGPEAELIITAARVHDIGKIKVPQEILMKPGALTPDERRIMETHAAVGADLLKRYPNFGRGNEIVRHHHERWDGNGYPAGLKDVEIPLGARVIAVVDSYDAMTSDRPYRRGFDVEKAQRILQEGKDTQWDARIVAAFLATRPILILPSVDPVPIPQEPGTCDQCIALSLGMN